MTDHNGIGGDAFATDFSRFWQTVQADLKRTANQLAETLSRAAEALRDGEPRLRKALESSAQLGNAGWTMPMQMTAAEMAHVASFESNDAIDAYFLSHCSKGLLEDIEASVGAAQSLEKWQTPIRQCFGAFRRGEYAITIPCLAAVFEASLRSFATAEQKYSTKVTKLCRDAGKRSSEAGRDVMDIYIWMSILAFVQRFYDQYGPAVASEPRVYRHGIQHGTQVPPNEQIEALRLLNAINTVIALCPCPEDENNTRK